MVGIFFAQDALQTLSDLNRFIKNQEAMILALEACKYDTKQVEVLEKEVQKLQEKVEEALEEKKNLQEEVEKVGAAMRAKYVDLLSAAQEFGGWADGLKAATDSQFHEMEERITQLISDNSFLFNRLTPLVEMEKAALEGQEVTGVLIAEADLEFVKKEVFDYTQELWKQATSVLQEHLAAPIDKFKLWFEAAGDHALRKENQELKGTIAQLLKQLEAE